MGVIASGRRLAAPGGSGGTAHRYWRFVVSAVAVYGGANVFGEIELLEGSVDATTGRGGFAYQSGEISPASLAIDDDINTQSVASYSTSYTWGVDLGSARDITAFSIRASSFGSDGAPRDFILQWSDNNSDWTTAKTVTNQTGWAAFEKRTFTLA